MQGGWKKSRTIREDREDIVKADQQDNEKLQYKKSQPRGWDRPRINDSQLLNYGCISLELE